MKTKSKPKKRTGGWIEYPWASAVKGQRVRLRRFRDVKDGDGKQRVWCSFYAAPELVIEVRVDSKLPLEMMRDADANFPARTFRDALEEIFWFGWQEAFWGSRHGYEPPVPKCRRAELMEEIAPVRDVNDHDDAAALWRVIERDGCCWMAAKE
jgi:hypothetical protein